MKNTAHMAAKIYAASGLSVVPIRTDGTKGLALKAGERKAYESRIATADELQSWFLRRSPVPGIAVLGGKVSGFLECIDFDMYAEEIFPKFMEIVGADHPDLVGKLVVNQTPRPGYHVIYRVTGVDGIGGSTKLASEPRLDRETMREVRDTIIETRAEGGYFIAPGSPATTHESHREWKHYSGPKLSQVQTITAAEREFILGTARSFNRLANPVVYKTSNIRPGDDFNARGPDIGEIIGGHGWTTTNGMHWKRPGKTTPGCSATWGVCKSTKSSLPLFHVFSSNAYPLEAEKSYDKFCLYTVLNHGGNYSAAAKALAGIGYGDQPVKKKSVKVENAIRLIDSLTPEELNEVISMLDYER